MLVSVCPTPRPGTGRRCALEQPNVCISLRTDTSTCHGAPRTLSQPPLQSGRHAPDGHVPDAPDPPPPECLSPLQAWRLRGSAVLRAHDVQPHVDEVCLEPTSRSLLRCNFCSPIVGAGARGVIVRRPTMFRPSLVASTTDRRT